MSRPVNIKYPLVKRDILDDIKELQKNGGGYPVVTLEDTFNIEAKPNTFYNIKNTNDSEVNINFKQEEFYATGKNKHIMFTWDNIEMHYEDIKLISYIGGIVVQDNSIEGYKYVMYIDGSFFDLGTIPLYLSDNIAEGASIKAIILGSEVIIEINNIHIINKDIDYLYYVTDESNEFNIPLVVLEEVENDSEFNYKYKFYSLINSLASSEYLYSYEPINIATSVFLHNNESYMELFINKVLNKDIETSDIVNEFVFNIISPATVVFNNNIKWNNDITPDLNKSGIYTISILNGIGCYTFVNN